MIIAVDFNKKKESKRGSKFSTQNIEEKLYFVFYLQLPPFVFSNVILQSLIFAFVILFPIILIKRAIYNVFFFIKAMKESLILRVELFFIKYNLQIENCQKIEKGIYDEF